MPTAIIIFLLVFGVVGLVVVFGKNTRGGGGDGGCNAWWFDGDNDGDGGSDGGDSSGGDGCGGGCGGGD